MQGLMIGVSGIRGIVGKNLTPELVTKYACAFGSFLGPSLVGLSRDTRPSGKMFRHAAIAGLCATGCTVLDMGVAATPTCSVAVVELGLKGAIQISGSHNPPEWNAIKLFRADGIDLNDAEALAVREIFDEGGFNLVPNESLGVVEQCPDPHRLHIARVLNCVDVDAVRRRRPKVVLDACNGAGAVSGPRLLEALGCEVVTLGAEPTGQFHRLPEPIPENLGALCQKVAEVGADVGFAQDADADRMAIADEQGRLLGEEYSLAMVTRFVLSRRLGPVVTNYSTTRAVEDIAVQAGCPLYRTKVGEVNVAERMKAEQAVIGGEGNGGIIDPRVCWIRDSLIGMALVLEYMASSGKRVSELAADLPRYEIVKTKMECPRDRIPDIFHQVSLRYPDTKQDQTDGLRVDWPRQWVHVRPSGTEPVVRVIAEAPEAADAQRLCDEVGAIVRECACA
jgi:phosphomannomutase